MIQIRQCNKCQIIKELSKDNFQPSFDKKTNKIYFKKKCRECEKIACQEYHDKNKDSILIRKRNYDRSHTKEKSEYNIIYNKKEESKKKNNIRAKKRYHLNKNNPIFKLRHNIKNSISKQLKRILSNKNGKSITKYLLFSITDLKEHLEKQFDKYMSWNNYGKYWHIDHIIPHSLFQYTSMEDQSFKDCWALNNLRPLEAKQNLSDGGSRIRHKK